LHRNAKPSSRDNFDVVRILAAGGETFCVQIGIRALKASRTLRLVAPDKVAEMPCESFVLMHDCEQPYLLPGDEFGPLAAGATGAFWLRLTVPRGTAPMTYSQELRVRSEDTEKNIMLQITVLPFDLPELQEPVYVLYTEGIGEALLTDDSAVSSRSEIIYRDMAAHGMNTACPTPAFRYTEGPKGLPEVAVFNLGLDFTARLGMNHPLGFFFVGNPLYVNKRKWTAPSVYFRDYLYSKRVQRLAYALAQRRERQAALFLIDEPGLHDTSQDGPFRNRLATLLYAKAHEVPGIFTAMTGSDQDFNAPGPYIDLWVFGNPARISQVERAMNMGASVTNYGGMCSAAGSGVAYRNKFGVYSWRSGEWGQTIWTYPLKMCAQASSGGVWPFTDWECIRAGVDDLKYLRLLETIAQQNPTVKSMAVQLFRALNGALHPERDHPLWTHVDPQKIRAAVINILLAGLQPALTNSNSARKDGALPDGEIHPGAPANFLKSE